MHRITARIRAKAAWAGVPNPPEFAVDIFNDSGSEVLHTIVVLGRFASDWPRPVATPISWLDWIRRYSRSPHGLVPTAGFVIEMRIFGIRNGQLAPLSEWFEAEAVLSLSRVEQRERVL